MLIEACTNSYASVINALQAGALRVELCSNLQIGGTTPSPGSIRQCRKYIDQLNTPHKPQLFVLIHPRGGDFCYRNAALEIMCEDIAFCQQEKVDGVVIGQLHPDGTINREAMETMMAFAKGMAITFHRAFDRTPDPFAALDTLIELGIERLLTSGQQCTALAGKALIAQLIDHAQKRIIIMPGSGVNAGNIPQIAQATKATEFHLSGKTTITSPAIFRPASMSIHSQVPASEYDYDETNFEKIKAAVLALSQINNAL